LLLKSQHQRNRSGPAQTDKGMTLVELLVGAIMAFIVITPMLAFVVDMLNTDRREQVKSNTEQDLQAAVDFIAQDLSQAIYIYNGKQIRDIVKTQQLAAPPNTAPILVFWKRQQIKKAVPIAVPIDDSIFPKDCQDKGNADKCDDTYVLSLVAYYQFKGKEATWCQPSGVDCPTRIARYEIREPVRNPYKSDAKDPYYDKTQLSVSQQGNVAFNPNFDFSKPTENVTKSIAQAAIAGELREQVLVNYIDHSSKDVPIPNGNQCQTSLAVTPPPPPATFNADDLLITDGKTHSFYACVDTSRNIARVTIRGNSLRRLQADANYNPKNSAYFPTATVQVQGLGGTGK
jgi:type II secretory pathway pseudopilin PulG